MSWLLEEIRRQDRKAVVGAALGLTAVAGFTASVCAWRNSRERILKRPFVIKDLANGEAVEDPEAELTKVISFLQDQIIRPLDARLPGRPFEHDLLAFPFTPMVLVVGNHSAGKSTFINKLLGISVQETGVAPTDDGFTVLQRADVNNEVEDGPTLLSCPQNRPFKELQRFGQPFWGHFRRKKLVLPEDTKMPYGLQIIDTPGMIDMPVKSESMAGGRGYNFLEVVRWFAKRADLILLLFDPDRPGTTGESLDVLTRSMSGLDHKFVIILNKVDQLDSSVDFARAYGTLGWALSKVIPRKDIPQIYTMYNSGVESGEQHLREHKLPLEAFRKKREEVVQEVLRAKTRHWDNVITATEDTMRQLEMVSTVTSAVRERVRGKLFEILGWSVVAIGVPGLVGGRILQVKWTGSPWVPSGFWASFALASYAASRLIFEYCKQYERLQIADLDSYFEECYAWFFIHVDAEDLRNRWVTVRPRAANILRAATTVTQLLPIRQWEIKRIDECLEKDVWYLRLLAKLLRGEQIQNGASSPK
eukprot:TRINITY_DN27542_c0_g1_i1.p1 TRINITY_DN27542_c0_g1~~TRINITY_DN27542_c0_g1_i1.p1  ORF type:complete len:533 (+),score=114.76 TRINITY_DN27542_c0_g1_i1:106-1704(+)